MKCRFLNLFITLCMLGNFVYFYCPEFLPKIFNFSCVCCHLLAFFTTNFFKKFFSETISECKTVLIQIRTEVLLVLIWVQTISKGYQQMTKVSASMERVNVIITHENHANLDIKELGCHSTPRIA